MTDDKLKELLAKSTPGPWKAGRPAHSPHRIYITSSDGHSIWWRWVGFGPHDESDAELITLAPTLAAEVLKLRESNRELLEALKAVSSLWPEPPHCADVLAVYGVNDGKMRAISLDVALKISRKAIQKAKAAQ